MNRFFYLSLFFWCAHPLNLTAAIPWNPEPYTHYSHGEDLKSLLSSFCATQGINAVISPEVKGSISGTFVHEDPKAFFEGMTQANALVWFYDGNHMYIDTSSNVTAQTIQVPYVDADQLQRYSKSLGYECSRGFIQAIPEAGLIQISGPAKYVASVAALASQLSIGLADKDVFRSFPLKYAWAQDTTVAYQGGSVTVPGVASQLQKLMFQDGNNDSDSTEIVKNTGRLGTPMRAQSLTPGNNADPKAAADQGQKDSKTNSQKWASPNASIYADVAHNAVTVRDSAGRIPLYEEAIAMLDQPVSLIEITVSIVDVGTQFTSELGNRLFGLSKTVNGAEKFNIGFSPTGGASDGSDNLFENNPANIGLTSNFSGTVSAYRFTEAIKVLEANNRAQTLSRPSVLTLDNTEAIIDRQQTFYITTSGQYSTDLFNVNAGTILRVTPHLIEESGKNKVKLLVNIQDGSIDYTTQVNSIPTVSQSSVTTQAIVTEGEGLLIAGQYNKSNQKGSTGIPILRNIPLIGALFGTKTKEFSTAERMYLITPKVIHLDQHLKEEHKQYFSSPDDLREKEFEPNGTSYTALKSEEAVMVENQSTL
jgi:type III secretion protein C